MHRLTFAPSYAHPWQLLWLLVATVALPGCDLMQPPALPEAQQSAQETLRRLQSGPVVGFDNAAGGHTWLGIPYALPPVGEYRWRAPRPPNAWSEPRESLRAGNPCLQYGSPLGGVGRTGEPAGSEDCLTLNVYAPRLSIEEAAQEALPVMVFVHGGGNTIGHAAFYDGSVLAAEQRVLVVMINYRLGPFGWFLPPAEPNTKEISTAEAPSSPDGEWAALDQSGNYGILDVIAALSWVKNNARALGGDPARVTVFGESAGGTNVLALLVSPLAEGLFHRAVIQSLGFGFSALPSENSPYATANILARLGLPKETDAPTLRALDPWTFYGAFERGANEWQRLPTVFQDGVVVSQGDIRDLLNDSSTHHDVPIILGTNRDEAKIFMAFDPAHTRKFAGLPYSLKNPVAFELESRYRARLWTADGVDRLAEPLASGEPAFAYRWDWDEQGKAFGLIDLSRLLGAAHALEIPFVTGHFSVGNQTGLLFHDDNAEGRRQLSRQMMGYWAEFARYGHPRRAGGIEGVPEWLPWPTRTEAALGPPARRLIFDTETGGGLKIATERLTREQVASEIFAEPIGETERCALFRATFRNAEDSQADDLWTALNAGRCPGPRWLAPGTLPPNSHR